MRKIPGKFELKESRPGMKRLHIDIDIDNYNRLRDAFIKRNMTMRRYVIGIILEQLEREDMYK